MKRPFVLVLLALASCIVVIVSHSLQLGALQQALEDQHKVQAEQAKVLELVSQHKVEQDLERLQGMREGLLELRDELRATDGFLLEDRGGSLQRVPITDPEAEARIEKEGELQKLSPQELRSIVEGEPEPAPPLKNEGSST